jgi:uncharacterized protein (TIGR03435 family)
MMGVMLRALLEDRFKVKVHKESRDKLVYVLTVARSSSNLQPSKEGSCTPLDVNNLQNTVPRAGDSCRDFVALEAVDPVKAECSLKIGTA